MGRTDSEIRIARTVWHFIWLQPPAFSTGLEQEGQGLLMAEMRAWFFKFSSCMSRSYSMQERPLAVCADEWK